MKINLVLIDMDGVIADLVGYLKFYFNKPDAKILSKAGLPKQLGLTEEELRKFFDNHPEIFAALKNTCDDFSLYYALGDFEINRVFICTRVVNLKAAIFKMFWLDSNEAIGASLRANIIFCEDKTVFARPDVLLIDDLDTEVKRFKAAGGQAILFPRPWNSAREYANEPQVYYISELKKIFEGDENEQNKN